MPIALYALTLAAISIGTAEFIIAGVLPDLSADLGVSIPMAGLLVSVYAFAVAVGGPIFALMTGRFRRKPMIIFLMLIFALGQVFCAVAPNYGILMAARIFVACGQGLFFGIGSVAAANLVPAHRRGTALSLFFAGITIANILGVPGGTALGNAFGWRAPFWAIGALALVATGALALLMPTGEKPGLDRASIKDEIKAVLNYRVLLAYLSITLAMIGALAFTTYQVPFLTGVSGINIEVVPFFLLLFGLGSVVGILTGGRLADWKLMPSMVTIFLVQAVFYAALVVTGPHPVLVAINMFLVGGISFAFNSPVQSRILHAARAAPNMAATLVSTAFNLGIAGGALVGGAWISAGFGYAHLPAIAIVTSVLAAGVAAFSWSLDGRNDPALAGS